MPKIIFFNKFCEILPYLDFGVEIYWQITQYFFSLIRSYQANWKIPTKNAQSSGIKAVKYSSSMMTRNDGGTDSNSISEPQLMRLNAYNTGSSASQAYEILNES